jgi:opacity protein-like surface antigen
MNKTILFVFAIMIFYRLPSESQLIRSYGIKGGLSLANQDWQYTDQASLFDQTKPRQGYDLGFFIEWFDHPLITVLSEIHYVQKGMKWKIVIPVTNEYYPDGTGEFISASGETWADYLSIPLLAKIRYSYSLVSIYIFAGPRFEYFLNNHTGTVLNNFNKWDFGGTIGIGFEINSLHPFSYGAEFRYSPNFQNSLSTPYVTAKNNSMEILLMVGY